MFSFSFKYKIENDYIDFISCFAAGSQSLPTRLTFEGIFSQTPPTSSASKGKMPINRRQSALEDDGDNSGNEDLKVIFTENLLSQRENHLLQKDVLKLQKEKLEAKMEYDIKTSELEMAKKQLELDTARELAKIQMDKQRKLAELEIKKMEKELGVEMDK